MSRVTREIDSRHIPERLLKKTRTTEFFDASWDRFGPWVWGFLGARGVGKDLAGAFALYDLLNYRRKKGLDVPRLYHLGNLIPEPFERVTQIELLQAKWLAERPEEAYERLHDSIIYIHEAHNYFNPRRQLGAWQQYAGNTLIQARKYGMSMVWSTQYERKISGDLLEQTDWMHYVTGVRRPWYKMPKYRLARRLDYRCAGFYSDAALNMKFGQGGGRSLRKAHKRCPEFPRRQDLSIMKYAQPGNPMFGKQGGTRLVEMYCAHRWWKLNRTEAATDAREVSRLDSEHLKAETRLKELESLEGVLLGLAAQGVEQMDTRRLLDYTTGTIPECMFDDKRLTSALQSLSVPRERSKGRALFDIGAWADDRRN